MRNQLKFLLLSIHIPIMGQVVNLTPYLRLNDKTVIYISDNNKAKTVTGLTNAEFITVKSYTKNSPDLQQPVVDDERLTPGEALAAVFTLLGLPPSFEQAVINIPKSMTLLLTNPHAYLGKMSPLRGEAQWLQSDGRSQLETINVNNGYIRLQWPMRKLGSPKGAKLILKMDNPTIATQFLWSDLICYGNDITKFLLHQVANWHNSCRHLTINRLHYREILFPTNLKDAIHHNQARLILEPYLQQAAPQLLEQLKSEAIS